MRIGSGKSWSRMEAPRGAWRCGVCATVCVCEEGSVECWRRRVN